MGAVQAEIDKIVMGVAARYTVPGLIARGQNCATKWPTYIKRYAGDVPFGLICVRWGYESNCYQHAQPTGCCGETGIAQVWMGGSWDVTGIPQPRRLGAVCSARLGGFDPYKPQHNIWCGLLGWNNLARRVYAKNPHLYPAPDAEFWGTTNIGLSLGETALKKLILVAEPRPGMVMSDIVAFVRRVGDSLPNYHIPGVGAASTAKRVVMTAKWIDAARSLSGLTTFGYGVANMPYSGVDYREPSAGGGGLVGLAVVGVGLWWAFLRGR